MRMPCFILSLLTYVLTQVYNKNANIAIENIRTNESEKHLLVTLKYDKLIAMEGVLEYVKQHGETKRIQEKTYSKPKEALDTLLAPGYTISIYNHICIYANGRFTDGV